MVYQAPRKFTIESNAFEFMIYAVVTCVFTTPQFCHLSQIFVTNLSLAYIHRLHQKVQ